MFRMVVGHSADVDAGDALGEALEQCARELGDDVPRGGLLFSTHEADPAGLIAAVLAVYPGLELIGSTSAAEMSSALGFQEGSVMLALFASDSIDITAGLGSGLHTDPAGAARDAVGEALGKTGREAKLCITVPAVGADPLPLFEALRRELGDGVVVLGGGSSATIGDPDRARQFCNDRIVGDGVPVLIFSGALSYSFGVETGWRPVGKRAKVTLASGNVVQEIDGRPALEFYERYLGAGAAVAPANPLAVFEEGSEDFYLRVAASHDAATGSILVRGGLPQDATVQLTVAMADEIFDGAKAAVQKALKTFPSGSDPGAALIVSCVIRKLVLGTRTGHEIEIARTELGGAMPICGFYSFGEIAPMESGVTRLHHEAMVAVLLGAA
ncbi:MAG: FIST N-terminal domain-containing protein [Actinomycetota bacterium]